MSNKTNLILDIGIFSAFLVVFNPRLTGTTIHEWLALSFAAALVTHLLFHWKWIATILVQFFRKLIHQSRLNFVVDLLFFIAMTAAMFSGLMISRSILPAVGIQLDVSRSWREIHDQAANISLILLGIHFALHWKWVLTNLGRYVVSPVAGLFRRPAPRPQVMTAQPVRIDEQK